jgi:hypothetical protein
VTARSTEGPYHPRERFGIDPLLIAAAVLLLGLAIAVRFVTRFRDAAYGLVIVWAYAGIVVKESGNVPVVATAGLGAVVVAVLVVWVLVRRDRLAGNQARPAASA